MCEERLLFYSPHTPPHPSKFFFYSSAASITCCGFTALTMKRYRGGFRLGRRLARIWRCVFRIGRRPRGCYLRLDPKPRRRRTEVSAVAARLLDWGRSLSRRLRPRIGDGKALLQEEGEEWRPPPKGHLVVYVGEGRKDVLEWQPPQRYVVPAIYFNHPLFGELLREAEAEFGFHHPGGITIPCPAAKFERVRTRIAAGGHHLCRKSRSRSITLE